MKISSQHLLDNSRSPRVQITYDVEVGGFTESRELPFVIGVMADLSAASKIDKGYLKDRQFINLSARSFNDVMSSLSPRISIGVKDCINKDKDSIHLDLTFRNLEDFEPLSLIRTIPTLREIYDARMRLSDLLGKLDGNDDLNKALDDVLAGEEVNADELIVQGKLVKDVTQSAYAHELIEEFLKAARENDKSGTIDSVAFINQIILKFDSLVGLQLDEILHHTDFQKLEGSWRGLALLVAHTAQSSRVVIRLLNISKDELRFDLEKVIEFDQSKLFKKIYEEEYGTFGGSPYSCLLADFEIGRGQADIELLTKLAQVAAAAHAPLIIAAHPTLFDLNSFTDIGIPRDLSVIFDSTEMGKWRSFRESEDARYVVLTLPHVLMRAPYSPDSNPVEGLNYVELIDGRDNKKFCWGNASWALAQRIANSSLLFGWPVAIRGVEGGGLVENLPYYTFKTTDGDVALKCPVEVAISDRREKELSDLGFIALCHCKNRDYAAFFSSQTAQKPSLYNHTDANANATLSARLSYVLAASRFAHYIKVIMRDKIGTFMAKGEVEKLLNNWIAQYVLLADVADPTSKARFPLREARIDIIDIPGKPGSYKATVFIRPHYQLEELTASIRLVTDLPKPALR